MKILLVSYSDISGGAAVASYRLNNAFISCGIDSKLLVVSKESDNKHVITPFNSKLKKVLSSVKPFIVNKLLKLFFKTESPFFHSISILNSSIIQYINNFNPDIVHLHWICHEMLSIKDLKKINKPIVWTLHDMWAFCGAEHYTYDSRWLDGYTKSNRPSYEKGFDINKWVFKRKQISYSKDIHIVTPSKWLAQLAKQSVLLRNNAVSCIPNTINTNAWFPIDKLVAKKILNLDTTKKIICFGASGGGKYTYKGLDLLFEAIKIFKNISNIEFELLIFGQSEPIEPLEIGIKVNYAGRLHDEISLQMIYRASDIFVIPSRIDNLPNTGLESLSCGTPVVAFDIGGLSDIVINKENGCLIPPFDCTKMAESFLWILEDENRYTNISMNAFTGCNQKFSNKIIVDSHLELYSSLLK